MKESYFERMLLNKIKKLEKEVKHIKQKLATDQWPYQSNGELMDNVSMSIINGMEDR